MAGGPGDRWSGHREMAGREESPDTVLSHQGTPHPPSAGSGQGATRLVTPGGRLGWCRLRFAPAESLTESATENVPPATRSTVASRRKTCETSSNRSHRLARVKRWGKSPPLVWQH